MWLNLFMLGAASLAVGFVLGWIVACPRRWDAHFHDEAAHGPDAARAVPEARDPSAETVAARRARVPIRERATALTRLAGRA
ncbi:hypothetical protein [Actinomadura harenae]|uniref:Uncharacterized protein n=1 Tax=Actinomadura harenae TaxID=2483351 RepID=A0A3M2LVY6_9ACTN|nr:hypothetical protein [Actinomadura harenae]RMI41372.1 hypothetical protein EBO15_23170 [Actinomadura harenae]